jgi:hypothetical protein
MRVSRTERPLTPAMCRISGGDREWMVMVGKRALSVENKVS